MKALLDSSILVAALVEAHPRHGESVVWLARARQGKVDLVIAAHSVAETFSVLTTLPARPRIDPSTAWLLLTESVLSVASLVTLSAADYRSTLARFAEQGLAGGVVYDGLIAAAAVKAGVDCIVTLDPKDFTRVWTGRPEAVVGP